MGRMKDLAKCRDCGTRRQVWHIEWIRAARPRCRACGGPLQQSEASAKEHAAHRDAKKSSWEASKQKGNGETS